MYEKFFALTKAPFSLVPDPDCIHLTAQHADAISGMAFGILERKGYLVLTGEAGLGKTTALRALSQLLAESNATAGVIFAPTLTPNEFLEMAMMKFGFRDVPASKAQRLSLLEDFLVRSDANGKVISLIVDEAHQLSPDLLEEIRLLGNFETADRKLLQIVLVGQNQLNDQLNLPDLWQLKQRITIRLSLRRLDRAAVEEYIRFRWGKAGGAGPIPFSAAALDGIAAWSSGIPRLINVMCDNALLIAFSQTNPEVDVKTVREACDELSLPTSQILGNAPSFAGARSLAPAIDESAHIAGENGATAEPMDAWAEWRPSLLKSLLRRAKPRQAEPTRSRSSIFSLNQP